MRTTDRSADFTGRTSQNHFETPNNDHGLKIDPDLDIHHDLDPDVDHDVDSNPEQDHVCDLVADQKYDPNFEDGMPRKIIPKTPIVKSKTILNQSSTTTTIPILNLTTNTILNQKSTMKSIPNLSPIYTPTLIPIRNQNQKMNSTV